MASAKAGVHVVQLKPIFVPDVLREGYKFVKWDDVSIHTSYSCNLFTDREFVSRQQNETVVSQHENNMEKQ